MVQLGHSKQCLTYGSESTYKSSGCSKRLLNTLSAFYIQLMLRFHRLFHMPKKILERFVVVVRFMHLGSIQGGYGKILKNEKQKNTPSIARSIDPMDTIKEDITTLFLNKKLGNMIKIRTK